MLCLKFCTFAFQIFRTSQASETILLKLTMVIKMNFQFHLEYLFSFFKTTVIIIAEILKPDVCSTVCFRSFLVHVTALNDLLDPMAVAALAGRYGCADVDRLGPHTALLTFSSPRTAQDLIKAAAAHSAYRIEKFTVTRHCALVRGLLWAGLSLSLLGLSATVLRWSSGSVRISNVINRL